MGSSQEIAVTQSTAAILEVKEEEIFTNSEIMSQSLSSRSSMSTMDSNQDHIEPLELGLVINALQNSLVEDNFEQQSDNKQKQLTSINSTQLDPKHYSSVNSQPKVVKRETTVVVDYELEDATRNTTSMPLCSANVIILNKIDSKLVKPNTLTPREQEKADEVITTAINHLFNNRFMKAKNIFEQKSQTDPLYALGLGSMAFLKAITTTEQRATQEALETLMTTYNFATAQIDNATKKNVGSTVIQYFTNYCNSIRVLRGSGIPTGVKPVKPKALEMHKVSTIPNGVLRAHVVKAEASLQMAILYLLQDSASGYVKCGLNLKRAYASYNIVWQEYKRTGQLHNEYIDGDTISGVQFGIGTVHLILSSLPKKILRIISAFGWKADKHLGFALLKLCLENRKARSTMSSVILLAYYTALTHLCPQILSCEYTQPAIETLLDAQKIYPNSSIFLYFAGRTSRLARNLNLSNQSFIYSIETSKNEWAEVELSHVCSYEIGFNYMMQSNWEEATEIFEQLYKEEYWSQVILRYLTGACLDMMGHRTDAILAYAEIPDLMAKQKGTSTNINTSSIEKYILQKIRLFQSSGYQDMDMTMCALEFLYLFNAFGFMDSIQLEQNLALTDYALGRILEAEKLEYGIRTRELLPETPPPQYFDQRGALLLIKASILNAMGRFYESIIHLNWIIDHKEKIVIDKWIVPFAYWEVGMTSWNLNQKSRGRMFWDKALSYANYDFEYRLAIRVNLAMTRAEEIGIKQMVNDNIQNINNPQQYNGKYTVHQEYESYEEEEENVEQIEEGNNNHKNIEEKNDCKDIEETSEHKNIEERREEHERCADPDNQPIVTMETESQSSVSIKI